MDLATEARGESGPDTPDGYATSLAGARAPLDPALPWDRMEHRGTPLLLAIIFGSLASLALIVLVAVIMTLLGYKDTEPLAWIVGQLLLWVYFTWLARKHNPWADPGTSGLPDGPIREGRHGDRVYRRDGVRRVSIPVRGKPSPEPPPDPSDAD